MPKRSVSRRATLKILGLGTAGTALFAGFGSAGADPGRADAAKLDANDPAALALGYVETAAAVDVKKYATFVPGSYCDNCLRLEGTPGSDYRPCGLFPGKLVAVRGWCSGWTPQI
jgi:hypothetical protein